MKPGIALYIGKTDRFYNHFQLYDFLRHPKGRAKHYVYIADETCISGIWPVLNAHEEFSFKQDFIVIEEPND